MTSLADIYEDISRQYENYKKLYLSLEEDKLLAQAFLYCHNGPSIIYEDGLLSEYIKKKDEFKITKYGHLYIRATSKIGDDGGPTNWVEDEDIYKHGYIIWSEDEESEEEDESIWDSDDEEKIMLSSIRNHYTINRAKINELYLQSSGDNGFVVEKNMAIAYVSARFMVVEVDPTSVKKFIERYQKK